MSINLVKNFSFEDGLVDWNTSGNVSTISLLAAFEEDTVAQLGGLVELDPSVLSQLIRVPPGATHFHVVYSVRPSIVGLGDLQVQVEFRGSANLDPPLPLRRRDIIDQISPGALDIVSWQTRYAVTGEIPEQTEWARLRFVRTSPILELGLLQIDAVYMTTD